MTACGNCGAVPDGDALFCPACGTPTTRRSDTAASADPYLGRVFAQKFRVDALLGEGGMGRVYRATHLSLEKTICLKVLRRELATDPETQARFQREARAASRLDHPHSIRIIDFGAAEGSELYIAMELVSGRDLQHVITDESPLPEARIRHVMEQVLDALAEAHAQKIIHRDLKPENVMVGPHLGDPDYVKVLDFGIAQIQDGGARLTRAGLVCGTPEYMSPEQARGDELDPRSDLYSSGVLLYQMATGRLPFTADTPIGYVTKHLVEPPKPPRALRPDISAELDQLIVRALAKNRDERPASAREMRAVLLGMPAPAALPLRAPEPVAAARKRSRAWAAAAAALVAVAVVALLRRGSPSAQVTAVAASPGVASASHAKAEDYFAQGKAAYFAGRYDAAIKSFERAAYYDPSWPEPIRELGICYQMTGDKKKAAAHLRRYLDFVPTPHDADVVQKMLAHLGS